MLGRNKNLITDRGVLREKRKKRRRITAAVLGIIFAVLGFSAAVFVGLAIAGAPQISALDAVPKGYRSTVLDVDGSVVLNLSKEGSNRVYVQLQEIPGDLQHAFIAAEDERFYSHHGVDIRGILRAIWHGVKSGSFSEGASTITQQLLKNNVFPAWTEESDFLDRLTRKIQEQYLAIRLENRTSKEWILENYLNTINLGGGNYGVETAAKYYFGKDVSDLTLSESAALAAITKNPTRYDPLLSPGANAERREHILEKMQELGFIDEAQKDEALADPVYERVASIGGSGSYAEIMTYFEDVLVEDVVGDLMEAKKCSEDEAWELLYTGGLTIWSTEDEELQEICERAAEGGMLPDADTQISMVLADSGTGEVRAMIGGRGEKDASLLLNRATDSVLQPGSVIKVIGEYAAGLEFGGLTLGTAIDDAPYTYGNGESIVNASGTYGGRTTVRKAIAASNNIVALKAFQQASLKKVVEQLEEFGITTLTEEDEVEALALGATYGGLTNEEITAAYGALARGGEYREPIYYTRVTDRDGNVILQKEQSSHRAVGGETAALLTSAMEDVLKEGTGTRAFFDGMAIAGKSGTTTEARDLWFVGYSPYYTLGVWGGRDDHGAQEDTAYVQEIWRQVMQEAHTGLEERQFELPGSLVRCTICEKCGKLAVEGLCDKSVQGDMTCEEIFAAGTEPTEKCDCHIAVSVCTVSGQKAGPYCRHTDQKVYLRYGTEGTADEGSVVPDEYLTGTCDQHKLFFSALQEYQHELQQQSHGQHEGAVPQEDGPEEEEEEEEEQKPHWWERLFAWW